MAPVGEVSVPPGVASSAVSPCQVSKRRAGERTPAQLSATARAALAASASADPAA
jgi:hypothetical protein